MHGAAVSGLDSVTAALSRWWKSTSFSPFSGAFT